MAKPTFSLPVIMDARTTKRLLDDEMNRYGGLIYDGSIAAASDPTLAQQVADDVAASASAAQQSAEEAALYEGSWLDDVAALLADTTLTYTADQPGTVAEGDYVRTRAEGFSYEVAASGATGPDIITTAGGVKLKVLGRTQSFAQWGIPIVDEEVNLFCDPVAGLDSNSGTLASPLKTIAAAVRRVPRLIDLVRVNINLHAAPRARGAASAFYDEDVLVSDLASRGTGDRDDGISGNRGRVFIIGDAADRDFVEIGSFTATSCLGRDNPTIMYFKIMRISPFDDNEFAGVYFGTCQIGSAWGISFADNGIKRGVQVYGGYVDAREIDVTNLTETGVHANRNGVATCRDFLGTYAPSDPDANTSAAYYATGGGFITFFDDAITLASGARRHFGRYGGKTIWTQQDFALIGETNSEERRQNTCFKIGLTSDYSTFTGTSVLTLPMDMVHIDNTSGPSYSGVQTSFSRILISPFAGPYRLEASVRVQFAGAATSGDISDFDLQIEDGEGTVVARTTVALWKFSAGATHQTVRCAGFVSPENAQQARFQCRIVDGSGVNNIIVADSAETFLCATLVG